VTGVAARRPKSRLVHGTAATAVTRRCPCRSCDDFRDRPSGYSHDPAWVDEVAVAEVAAGQGYHERLSLAEREAVVRLMHGWRINDQDIARRTGMNARTVLRIRQRLDLEANA
jgi:DNA-binding CsgD family transcriptional regulator